MITYQELSEGFVASTARLAYKIFKPTKKVDFNKVIEDFNSSDSKCFIAIEDNEVIGFVTLNVFKPLFTDYPKAHISWIAVDPAYRGQGISKILLQMAEQFCKNQECRYIDLSSRIAPERMSAHALYTSFGFKSDTQKYFIKHLYEGNNSFNGRVQVGSQTPISVKN